MYQGALGMSARLSACLRAPISYLVIAACVPPVDDTYTSEGPVALRGGEGAWSPVSSCTYHCHSARPWFADLRPGQKCRTGVDVEAFQRVGCGGGAWHVG